MFMAAVMLLITIAAVWDLLRRRPLAAKNGVSRRVDPLGAPAAPNELDVGKLAAVNLALSERLFRVSFAAPAIPEPLGAADLEIRAQVCAVVRGSHLDARFFPRRPTLMPQLLQAMQDPTAATERLSRIVAHDPVLAADVLRLANSSRFRTTPQPIETIPRAIVVMGVDALRGLLAVAMMQPVFRASRDNFPRFPRMLWERTERAARAADAFALRVQPADRFESQLAILLSALGPLAVYGATLDIYSRSAELRPNAALCLELTSSLGTEMAVRIARQWETSPRLAAVIEKSSREPLAQALCVGELLGNLSMLELQHVITPEEAQEIACSVALEGELLESVRARAA